MTRPVTLLLAALALALPLSLLAGRAWIDPTAPFGPEASLILAELRLPRAVLAILLGAGLGASGAAMQGYLRNPLADPGLFGIAPGAALGAVLSFWTGWASTGWALPTFALLGAAGLGDIGRHFPDTDERFKGADSVVLLQEAHRRVREAGWGVVNLDTTIVAQAPKMAPHIGAMRQRIAQALGLDETLVNVKAKTAEKMGPVGEGRAIETRAVCLLYRL